ncbi:MAG: AAA family ATPase [Azonexus sp.]
MQTIAILGQKGGSGKSTIAVHLAVCAARQGFGVAIIDLDPQASAAKWRRRRKLDGPEVIGAQQGQLSKLLRQAGDHGADLVVVDTAPHTDAAAMVAAEHADLILVPCRPSAVDIDAIGDTFAVLKLSPSLGKARILLNAVPSRGTSGDEVSSGLATFAPVVPVRLGQRAAYAMAWNTGRSVEEYEPRGKAAAEIKALHHWIMTSYFCGTIGVCNHG